MLELAARDIRKTFLTGNGSVPALDGLTVEAEQGEFVVLLGPSGCGKSTFFNILAGLIPFDEGVILFRGRKVPHLQGHIAYMVQKDLLFPWRTVLKNVLLGPEVEGRDLRAAEAEARRILAEFGLAGFEDAYPAQLSGGMRQRAALARTLLMHKEVLLLDEPFGALDAITRAAMGRLLLRVWETYRPTILLVTHDVEEALTLADRIFLLSRRPARTLAVFDLTLPRPRDPADSAFVRMKREILELLQREAFPDLPLPQTGGVPA